MLNQEQIDTFAEENEKREKVAPKKSPSVLDPLAFFTFPGVLMARLFKDSKESSILRYNKSKSKD